MGCDQGTDCKAKTKTLTLKAKTKTLSLKAKAKTKASKSCLKAASRLRLHITDNAIVVHNANSFYNATVV